MAESGATAAVVGEALVHVLLAVGAGPVRQITAAGVSIVPRVDAAAIVLARGRQARVVPAAARAQKSPFSTSAQACVELTCVW